MASLRADLFTRIGVTLLVLFIALGMAQSLLVGTRWWPEGIYNHETGFDITIVHPSPPISGHLLGTDYLGRDILSMVAAGARGAAVVGLAAAATTTLIGLAVASAVVATKPLQAVARVISDTSLLLPAPVLLAVIGSNPSLRVNALTFGIVFGVLTGASTAGIVLRSAALPLTAAGFVDVARIAGAGRRRIFTHHILPHLIPLTAVYAFVAASAAVITDGFLAWRNLIQSRFNWGTIVYNSLSFRSLFGDVPLLPITVAATAITLFALSFYLIATGIRRSIGVRHDEG
jgi:peptide/nickel transport system permease protein